MDKKGKDKLVGSLALLIIAIIFLIIGYFISKPKEYGSLEDNDIEKECSLIYTSNDYQNEENNGNIDEFECGDKEDCIVVDIKGAIKKPGAYKLKKGSRVEDLVKIAGGFTENADMVTVHLSKKLYDEDYIYIKKKGEKERQDLPINNNKKQNNSYVNKNKININSATLEQLKTLPGIGDVKAKSIIDYRTKKGVFRTVNDLLNVKGIGNSTLDNLRNLLVVK